MRRFDFFGTQQPPLWASPEATWMQGPPVTSQSHGYYFAIESCMRRGYSFLIRLLQPACSTLIIAHKRNSPEDSKKRLRSIRHVAVHLTPRSQPEHVLTLMLLGTRCTASRPPVVLYHRTLDTADPSPEFPEIAFTAAANGVGEKHLNQDSSVRILLLSHARQRSQAEANGTCDTIDPRIRWRDGPCQTCAAQRDECQPFRSEDVHQPPEDVETCASCVPEHVPFAWHYGTLPTGAGSSSSNTHQTKSASQRDNIQGLSRRSALPTITESRSFNASGRSSDGDGQGPMTARIYVDGTKSCSLELQVAAAVAQQSKPTIRRSSTGGEHFIEGDSRKNSNGHSNDSSRTVNATDASLNLSSVWELRALNPQDAKCLVDASLDLGDSLTPVPMPFSSLHSCSVLPMRTIMLGLGNATQGSATRHALFSSGVQPAALFLYPKLSDRALQQFIEDNRTTKEWPKGKELARRPQQAPHGVLDLIRNALPFPLPFHSSRPSRLPPTRPALARINSSPSLQPGASQASSGSLPNSARGVRTSARPAQTLHRFRNDASSDTRASVSGSAALPMATGWNTSAASAHQNSMGASDSSTGDSESESASDSQTFYGVAKRAPKLMVNGGMFQASLPAMQYCAFVIPPTLEQTNLQRAAEQRTLSLRARISKKLKESQDRLDLAARVKRLQVKTQQLRSWSDGLNKKLLAARRATAARKQRVSALSERLRCASGDDGPLAAALKRSRDIRACYPDMMYSLRHTHGLLITRRNSLVVSLFQHFRLQPMALKAYTDGVLSDMQDRWMHQPCLNPQRHRSRAGPTFTSLQPASSSPSMSPSPRRRGNGAAASPTRVGPRGQNTLQQGQTDGITSRLTPVMTIMGLLCSPDVARRAQLGELGLDTSQPLQVDRLNAAYGLIAQVVVFLGVILDTPPLFHIVLDGSSCSIQQYIPRFSKHGTVEPEHSEEDLQGQHALRLTEHPLHVEQGKHDKLKKFAWACFLLGTDVQLILHEHDIVPYGQQFLLENLDKLVACARMSGVKPTL